ncbi:hypothetical protein [Congregicoccus parvus]|uniref:hypothetical protein n=1 Tax=Congregicoccus parvus TaxID=3081749 RepID=UPI003FA5F98B
MAPKLTLDRIQRVINAWETLTPDKSFAGMTLAQFKEKMAPSLDARTAIDQLKAQLAAAYIRRIMADTTAEADILLVVNAVRGDPSEGPDGELYKAMGYIPKAERRSGLHRKKPVPTPVPPLTIAA